MKLRYNENRHQDAFGNWFRYNSKAWIDGGEGNELPVKTTDVFLVVKE